ncbi:MAG: class I SAM-dependent methyltransferase [Burkholderiales bacterium]
MTLPATTRRPVTPDEIDWFDDDAPVRDAGRCPACDSHAPARPLLSVPQLAAPYDRLELLRCGRCGSAFFDPPGVSDFANLDQVADDSWRHYVEAGGGVWETIWPILAARTRGSLLDIGCGFGFALDFWQRTGRGEAVGSEAADYGRLGARLLGVTIHGEHVERCGAPAGRRFDIVYASEVIEHVPDPRAFATTLARFVADDGVLALTTPAASYVHRRNAGLTLLAALAPGFHGFVLSIEAFAEAARAAGFEHVETRVQSERQFLWASRRPLAIAADPGVHLPALHAYLADRAADAGLDASVRDGYRYRLLRDQVQFGRWQDAQATHGALARGLVGRFGPTVLEPGATLPALEACATSADVGRVGPYFLPSYYQLRARLEQHSGTDPHAVRRCYREAARATLACTRIAPLHFLEAAGNLWRCRIDQALLGLALGDESEAAALAEALERGGAGGEANAHMPVDTGYLEALLPTVVEQLTDRGLRGAAATLADAYRRHVGRRYGPSATAPQGVDAALSDAGAALPGDPLAAPWLDALGDLADAATHARGVERTRELVAIADRHAAHPRFGRALMAFGRRARVRAGLEPPPPIVSFETSFTIAPRRR